MLAEIYLLKLEAAVRAAKEASEFERALADFAGAPNGGLIVPLSTSAETHRTLIVALADRHRLPAGYPSRGVAATRGLIPQWAGPGGQNRGAAGYVDGILKGEKPADLPVQAPTKYECRGRLCVERRSAAAAAQRGGGEGHQGAGAKD